MTTLAPTTLPETESSSSSSSSPRPAAADASVERRDPVVPTATRKVSTGRLVIVWAIVSLVVFVLVLYALEPLFQQNNQDSLMTSYTEAISNASFESGGLQGVSVPTKPPGTGDPVGILDIAGIRLQQVVVEGVAPSQTQKGPGHVPGTAAPGQPGNSAVIGRRAMFGGPFDRLDQLQSEDLILVTTTQGQVVYKVDTVEKVEIVASPSKDSTSSSSTPPTTSVPVGGTGGDVASETGSHLTTLDKLYGPSKDDRLTLITSAGALPTNSSMATVVVAKMQGTPYQPTPQAGRSDDQNGNSGESGSWPAVLLALQAFVLAAGGAVYFYRRSSPPVAYLLTTAPLLAFAIIAAEQVSRVFPAWS